jgi:uncharacterized protein (DUF736 family)
MSNFVPKEGFGALFRNTKKTEDKQPDYRGNIQIKGEAFILVAWVKEGKNGKFLSMKIEAQDMTERKPAKTEAENESDDLPF